MKTYLKEVDINKPNYLGGSKWHLRNLSPITVLFGKNGSGKSLLLRSWRDIDSETSHYVVPERTGNIEYNPRYLQQQANSNTRRSNSQQNWANDYRQHVIGRIHTYFIARGASRGREMPGDPADLEFLINQLFPDFEVGLDGQNPPYSIKRDSPDQKVTNVNQLSSGEAQLMTLSIDVLTIAAIWNLENRNKRLLLVDEPDAHIHPDLQARFADFLVQVAEKFALQVVVATHSTTLLSALGQFGGDSTSVIYLDRLRDEFDARPFSDVLKELSACLGGHVLMGTLFSVPLMLVEGDDDYRIWSQVPRHHIINVAVIPCGGDEIKNYQKSLERILSSLRDEQDLAGFALLDGDKSLPQKDTTDQNHIEFVKLECHEAENLYLTDEVLSDLGHNWEEAIELIKERAGEFGQKEPILSRVADWDRKEEDIKEVIEELSRILDMKNIHWTVRVGKAIGRERPKGQILDFLGNTVVDRLWE